MTPSSVGILDIKNVAKKQPSPKKEEAGFDKELSAREGKLKKRDDDINPNAAPQAPARQPTAAAPKAGEVTGEKIAPKILNGVNPVIDQAPGLAAAVAASSDVLNIDELVTGEGAAAVAVETPVTEAEMAADMLGALNLGKMAALKKEGSISLEGFQAITPQAMPSLDINPVLNQAPSAETASLVAAIDGGAKEQNLQDLLSQDSSSETPGFELGVEGLSAHVAGAKESVNGANHFAQVLEAKATEGTETLRQANVDNVVTQARTILKDGGGEMQIQLRPDGLGTIDLKVGVDNGQVSVEIMAEDAKVRKMFEDSVHDIRGALESQSLKIETLKVSQSDNASSQMQQGQPENTDREFARNFMNQFRDERQSFRNQTMQQRLDTQAPFERQAPEGLRPAVAGPRPLGANSRLNVIA